MENLKKRNISLLAIILFGIANIFLNKSSLNSTNSLKEDKSNKDNKTIASLECKNERKEIINTEKGENTDEYLFVGCNGFY